MNNPITDHPLMSGCGNHTYCCWTDDDDCCSVGPTFELKPVLPDPRSTVSVTSVVDHLSTISILSVQTVYHTPVTTVTATQPRAKSTLPRPVSSTRLKFSTSATPTLMSDSLHFSDIETAFNASHTTGHHTSPDISTSLSRRSLQSTGLSPTPSMSILQPTSSPTPDPSNSQTSEADPPAEHHPPKTSVGLGIGLCLILGFFFVGAMIWFIRRQRRKPQKKRYHISYPISIKSIPMFEVANTDWEMPVDRDMPTEMSANRQTEQNWI